MAASVDPRQFRQTMGHFATGVSVIATEVGGEIHGMTANALSSLSIDPMLVLFCVDKRTKMSELMKKTAGFSVNFLRDEQQALSTYFAGGWKEPKAPPFRFVPWEGSPRLEGSVAALACRLFQKLEGGDHWIILGEVLAIHMGIEPRYPLVFYSGMYRKLDRREIELAPQIDEAKSDMRVFFDPWNEA